MENTESTTEAIRFMIVILPVRSVMRKGRVYYLTVEDIGGQEICLRLRMCGELEKQRLVYEALIVGEEYGIDFFIKFQEKLRSRMDCSSCRKMRKNRRLQWLVRK